MRAHIRTVISTDGCTHSCTYISTIEYSNHGSIYGTYFTTDDEFTHLIPINRAFDVSIVKSNTAPNFHTVYGAYIASYQSFFRSYCRSKWFANKCSRVQAIWTTHSQPNMPVIATIHATIITAICKTVNTTDIYTYCGTQCYAYKPTIDATNWPT